MATGCKSAGWKAEQKNQGVPDAGELMNPKKLIDELKKQEDRMRKDERKFKEQRRLE